MGRTELIVNNGYDRSEKSVLSTGKHRKLLVKNQLTYSEKLHEMPKESSFRSSSTSSSSETEEETKSSRLQNRCGFLTLCLALIACSSGCYIMWATNLFTLFVHQNLVISNNSMRYKAWKALPVQSFLRVYLFNYTNVERFESGADKTLKIEELGPYTYIEKWERVDVKFNENGTATYRDKKTYRFSPENSQRNETDFVVVPNIPFLSALSLVKEVSPFIRWSLIRFMKMMGAKPFITLKASDFFWGYEDRFAAFATNLLSFRYNLPFKKFGILSAKNGTQRELVTIYTGENDSAKTGIVVNYDGRTSLNIWNTQECNRIDGTDGTIYPPAMIHSNSTLYIYSKDLCRKMPLTYSSQYQNRNGIHVMRFRMPKKAFASGHEEKENLCFCSVVSSKFKCLPSGIFNVGPCAFEAPLVTSLPHFLHGDVILTSGIEGLKPEIDKHESFVEIDSKMGLPVGGKSRLQLNIMHSKEYGSPEKNKIYSKQLVFPIAWMDYGFDRLPDEVSSMIRTLLAFIKIAEISLSYGFIVCTIFFGILFVNGCCRNQPFRSCSRRLVRESKELQSETPLFLIHNK